MGYLSVLERNGGKVTERDPRIILLGYGVKDTLQLTVEAQRILARVGKAYALHAPANLKRYLKSLRVECVELADRFSAGRSFADVYLEVTDLILRRAADERPVVLLSPGNPLFLNTISRFLVQKARERKLSVQVCPGVSGIDSVFNYLGFDVGSFGLQMFDARRLVERKQQINPKVPLLILQPFAFAAGDVVGGPQRNVTDLDELAAYLRRFYAADHSISLINVAPGAGQPAHVTASLQRFPELAPYIDTQSNLFIDRVRNNRTAKAAVAQTQGV